MSLAGILNPITHHWKGRRIPMQRSPAWKKWTAAMLLTGAVLAPGTTLAAPSPARAPEQTERAPEGLSPAQKEVLNQLRDLRKRHREQLQQETREVVEKAVKDGKLTRQEADQLLKRLSPRFLHQPKSVEEMKAQLDEAVRAGRISQEQADRILQRFKDAKAKADGAESSKEPTEGKGN